MRTAAGMVCVVMNRGGAAWKGCSSRDFTQNAERAGVFSGPFFCAVVPIASFCNANLQESAAGYCDDSSGIASGSSLWFFSGRP